MKLGRAPQGARGLKSFEIYIKAGTAESRPARGAWVEIPSLFDFHPIPLVAPRKGRVG